MARLRILTGIALATFALAGALAAAPARADDPDFVTVAGGWCDMNRQKQDSGEFRLEYRSDKKFFVFKPFGGAMATTDGASYYYAGILIDVFLGRRVVLTPSFAPVARRVAFSILLLRPGTASLPFVGQSKTWR